MEKLRGKSGNQNRISETTNMPILECKGSLQPKWKGSRNTYKIALFTPYTGGNLGDAAIQEAVITNIKRRHPGADIYLITLCPEVTAKVHGIPSLPIASWAITGYSLGLSATTRQGNDTNTSLTSKYNLMNRIKAAVERAPWLYTVLTHTYKSFAIVCKEILHIVKAYKFMRGVSLLLISGGGQLDDYWGGPWGHPYALFKWGLLARVVGARSVFLSVGTCALEARLSNFFIRHALRIATYRSYRDLTSKRLLKHMAFTHKDAVYPDLAFSYVNKRGTHRGDSGDTGRVVGLSPIAYLSRYGWPKTDFSIYDRYFGNLVYFISNLVRQGYSIVLFATDLPDRKVVNDIVDSLRRDVSLDIQDKIHKPFIDTVDDLIAQLLKVDYVIASRLHGIILSHLLCIPVLAISYDRKVETHMADIGLSEYCMDFHRLETVALLERFELLTTNGKCVSSILQQKNADYIHALEGQYDCLLGK
jgi:polysaccharide pyruvyl transferase WcaK-like protein